MIKLQKSPIYTLAKVGMLFSLYCGCMLTTDEHLWQKKDGKELSAINDSSEFSDLSVHPPNDMLQHLDAGKSLDAGWFIDAALDNSLQGDQPVSDHNSQQQLYDNFNDNSLNLILWSTFTDNNTVTVKEHNQRLEMSVGSGKTGSGGIESQPSFDLQDSDLTVEIASLGNQGEGGLSMGMLIRSTDKKNVGFEINQHQLHAQTEKNKTTTTLASVPCSSSNVRYLRLRESGGTTYWEYSADNNIYHTLTSVTNPLLMKKVVVVIWAGAGVPLSSSTSVAFDNVLLK